MPPTSSSSSQSRRHESSSRRAARLLLCPAARVLPIAIAGLLMPQAASTYVALHRRA
ncbi:hypothetical protein U9M48_025311 [Paspalum notatum var. saurae]|uniref:Uncharacterized protein n=1 Tax=Paspalum notatum var. saurae TaxID=547442 RepID=A0AAQ3TUP0_PASNO